MSDSYDPTNCSQPGSSVYGILQARILEWVAVSFFRGSSQSRNWTQASHIAGRCFYRLSGIKAILDKTASVLSGIEAVVHYHTPALLKSILDEAVKPFKYLFHILYDEMGSKYHFNTPKYSGCPEEKQLYSYFNCELN